MDIRLAICQQLMFEGQKKEDEHRYEEALELFVQSKQILDGYLSEKLINGISNPYSEHWRFVNGLIAVQSVHFSQLNFQFGNIQEAFNHAVMSTVSNASWYKGHFQKGKLQRYLHNYPEAIQSLFTALQQIQVSETDPTKIEEGNVEVLQELVTMLPNESIVTKLDKNFSFSASVWTTVLRDLTTSKSWKQIYYLLSCPPGGALAESADSSQIDYSDVLKLSTKDWQEWGEILVIVLLSRGSDLSIVSHAENLPLLHAAVSIGIRHRTKRLIRYVVETCSDADKNTADSNGNSVLTLVSKATNLSLKEKVELTTILVCGGVDGVLMVHAECNKVSVSNREDNRQTQKKGKKELSPMMVNPKLEFDRLKASGMLLETSGNLDKALLQYHQAIDITEMHPDVVSPRELADTFIHWSEVLFLSGQTEEALDRAADGIRVDDKWYKGFYQLGKVMKRIKRQDAERPFLYALGCLRTSAHDETKVEILEDLSEMLPNPTISSELRSNFPFLGRVWTKVLNHISQRQQWISVSCLLLTTKKLPLAHEADTSQINYSSVLDLPSEEWKKWGEWLVMELLKRGSKDKYLCKNEQIPVIHATLKLGIRQRSPYLFQWMLSQDWIDPCVTDSNGNSLLHVLGREAIISGPIPESLLDRFASLLEHRGVKLDARNNDGLLFSEVVPDRNANAEITGAALEIDMLEQIGQLQDAATVAASDKRFTRAFELLSAAKGLASSNMLIYRRAFASVCLQCSDTFLLCGKATKALHEIQEALSVDRDWYMVHMKMAIFLKKYYFSSRTEDTITAFSVVLQLHPPEEDQFILILELVELFPKLKLAMLQRTSDMLVFRNIPVAIWSKVIKTLAEKEQWEVISYLLPVRPSFMSIAREAQTSGVECSCLLKLPCKKWKDWGECLLIEMMSRGAYIKALDSCRPTVHEVLQLELRYGTEKLFPWLLQHPSVDVNCTDSCGNSLLHVIATTPRLTARKTKDLISLLLQHGIDENRKNDEGFTYQDLLPKKKRVLKKHQESAKSGKTSGTAVQRARKAAHGTEVQRCSSCPKAMNAILSLGHCSNEEKTKKLLVSYIGILRANHKPCISEFKATVETTIDDIFKNVGQDSLKDDMKCWNDTILFLELYKDIAKSNVKHAENISIVAYLQSGYNLKNAQKRIDALDLLLFCGGQPNGMLGETMKPLQVAFLQKYEKAITCLMKYGGDVNSVCQCDYDNGESIFHIAFKMGLKKDSFELFQQVTKEVNPEKCDLKNVQDTDGNSLLHILALSSSSKEAVEMLCKHKVNTSLKNKRGKTALQLLHRKDVRFELLKEAYSSARPSNHRDDMHDVNTAKVSEVDGKRLLKLKLKETKSGKEDGSLTDLKECEERISMIISDLMRLPAQKQVFDDEDYRPQEEAEVTNEQVVSENHDNCCEDKKSEVDCHSSPIEDNESEDDESYNVDDEEFGSLEWEVECTSNVWKTLRSRKVKTSVKQQIVRKIKLLAHGEWRDKLCKPLEGVPQKVKLFEARVDQKVRILWERAIAFSFRRSEPAEKRLGLDTTETVGEVGGRIYSEIIRVWDIVFDHDNVNRIKDTIVKSIARGETCIIQKNLKGITRKEFTQSELTRKEIPMLFTESVDVDRGLVTLPPEEKLFPPASANETEFHIMKFYSFSSSLVATVLNDTSGKVDFPFRVSELEDAVINLSPKSAILLLGRSGTGKTTCCLYRMWSSFLNYWRRALYAGPLMPRTVSILQAPTSSCAGLESVTNNSDSQMSMLSNRSSCDQYDHLHQIFITKNVVLCSEVKKNFLDMCHGSPTAVNYIGNEDKGLPTRLQDVDDFAYPLFVTSKQFLIVLDASLPEPYFFNRNVDGKMARRLEGWSTTGEEDLIPDLHDPYDSDEESDSEDETVVTDGKKNDSEEKSDVRKQVTFEVFVNELWPKINKNNHFQASLVWEEIMSFIKGSIEALSSENGHLFLATYLELGRKRAPNYSNLRSEIYNLFLVYQRMLRNRALFDECDVVFHIYKRMKHHMPAWVIHEIFVDETQDFTQAELSLLIRCCQDPNRMFLTGDTAQNIMRGISFRFEDLKSLFFYASESMKLAGKDRVVHIPKKVHKLPYNYRSHEGVLGMASSVVDLMTRYFPESFDKLTKDQGLFAGPKPVIFESCNFDDLALVLRSNMRQTSHIEFGAHQVILVADDAARNRLPEELNLSLVLTIYEAKGLEFDDILLYNFFKDSQVNKEWRVVAGYLKELRENGKGETVGGSRDFVEEIAIDRCSEGRARPLAFDGAQHQILISEFKNLYTAITRARVNVWIFDEDEEKRTPMFEYFRELGLAEVIKMKGDDSCDEMPDRLFMVKSTRDDWRKRADVFYKNKLFKVAAKAYAKAGDSKREIECLAHVRVLQLTSNVKENRKNRRKEFTFIAEQFLQCEQHETALKCLLNAKRIALAARLCFKLGMYDRAAKLHQNVGDIDDAVKALENALNYRKAVRILYDKQTLPSLEEAMNVIQRYDRLKEQCVKENDIPQKLLTHGPLLTASDVLRKLIFIYKQDGLYVRMLKTISELPNDEEKLDALRPHFKVDACLNFAVDLLVNKGKEQEAADLLRSRGKLFEAASVSPDDVFKAQCYLSAARLDYVLGTVSNIDREKLLLAKGTMSNGRDIEGCAEACFLLGVTEQSTDMRRSYLEDAYRYYVQSRHCCGMVDALEAMESPGGSYYTRRMVDTIDELHNLVDALQKQELSGSETEMLLTCLRYWGLSSIQAGNPDGTNGTCRILHTEGARFRKFVDSDFVVYDKFVELITTQLKTSANEMRCSLDTILGKQLKECQQCPLYSAGYPCSDANHNHNHGDTKVLAAAMKTHVTKLMLDHVSVKHNLGSKCDRIRSLEQLLALLFPVRGHSRCIKEKMISTEVQRKQICKAALGLVADFWKEANCDHNIKWSCTDNYILMIKSCLLFGSSRKYIIQRFLVKVEKDYVDWSNANGKDPSKVPNTIGIKCIVGRDGSPTFFSFSRHLLNYFEQLHTKGDPHEAVGEMNKFFGSICFKAIDPFFPTLANACHLLELQVVLCLSMYARHRLKSSHVLLPASYLSQVKLWDAMNYQGHPFKSMFASVQFYIPKYSWEKHLNGRLGYMLRLLVGEVNPAFHVVYDSFSNSCSEFLQSGESERVLILCLVIVCNCGLNFPWEFATKIRKALTEIQIHSSIVYPERILRCLKRVREARVPKDNAIALAELLQERDDEFLYTCYWTWPPNPSGIKGFRYERTQNYDTLPRHSYVGRTEFQLPKHDQIATQHQVKTEDRVFVPTSETKGNESVIADTKEDQTPVPLTTETSSIALSPDIASGKDFKRSDSNPTDLQNKPVSPSGPARFVQAVSSAVSGLFKKFSLKKQRAESPTMEGMDETDDVNPEYIEAVKREQQLYDEPSEADVKHGGTFHKQNSPTGVDENFCRICGKHFVTELEEDFVRTDTGVTDDEPGSYRLDDDTLSNVDETSRKEFQRVTKLGHLNSVDHWKNQIQFNHFDRQSKDIWIPLLQNIAYFLATLGDNHENSAVQRLINRNNDFEMKLRQCREKYQWTVLEEEERELISALDQAKQSSNERQVKSEEESDEDPDIARAFKQSDDDMLPEDIVVVTEKPKSRRQRKNRDRKKKKK